MNGGRSGFKPSQIVIYGPNHHQFVVSTNTLAAENTLAQVSDNKWVRPFQPCVMRHGIQAYRTHTQFGRNLPQLASVPLVAYNAGLGVVCHHEADNICAVFSDSDGVCLDGHAGRCRCDAGGHDAATVFVFHQTQTTRSGRNQVPVVAEGGDFDAVFRGRIQYTGTRPTTYVLSVDAKADLLQDAISPRSSVSFFMAMCKCAPLFKAVMNGLFIILSLDGRGQGGGGRLTALLMWRVSALEISL
jgi:hypothetical protein